MQVQVTTEIEVLDALKSLGWATSELHNVISLDPKSKTRKKLLASALALVKSTEAKLEALAA